MPAPSVNTGHTKRENSNSVMTHTINAPTYSEGDAIYIAIVVDGNQLIVAPTGFTAILNNIDINATDQTATLSLFRKVSGASEPSSYAPTTVVAERSVAIAWSQSDDNGEDVSGTDDGDSNSASCPSVTTTEADTLILRIVGTDSTTMNHGTATGHTFLDEVERSSGGTISVQHKTQATAGVSGAATVSLGATNEWVGATVAIKGVSAGGGNAMPMAQTIYHKRRKI